MYLRLIFMTIFIMYIVIRLIYDRYSCLYLKTMVYQSIVSILTYHIHYKHVTIYFIVLYKTIDIYTYFIVINLTYISTLQLTYRTTLDRYTCLKLYVCMFIYRITKVHVYRLQLTNKTNIQLTICVFILMYLYSTNISCNYLLYSLYYKHI